MHIYKYFFFLIIIYIYYIGNVANIYIYIYTVIYLYISVYIYRWYSAKESAYQCMRHRDMSLIPGPGRSPAAGNGNPFQYFYLENPMEKPGGLQSMGSQSIKCD